MRNVACILAACAMLTVASGCSKSDVNAAPPAQTVPVADQSQPGHTGAPSQADTAVEPSEAPAPVAQPENLVPKESARRIGLEMIVTVADSAIACMTKDGLIEISMHIMRGEETKANAYLITPNHEHGECVFLRTDLEYKVLSVKYNYGGLGEGVGFMELVKKNDEESDGAWAFVSGAIPAK